MHANGHFVREGGDVLGPFWPNFLFDPGELKGSTLHVSIYSGGQPKATTTCGSILFVYMILCGSA